MIHHGTADVAPFRHQDMTGSGTHRMFTARIAATRSLQDASRRLDSRDQRPNQTLLLPSRHGIVAMNRLRRLTLQQNECR